MTLPAGWPPTGPSGRHSLRWCKTGTGTAAFDANAWMFGDDRATALQPNVQPTGTTVSGAPSPHTASPAGAGPGLADASRGIGVAAPGSPPLWSSTILVQNTHTTVSLEISFDGVTVHGVVPPSTTRIYWQRYESGICVRGNTATFVLEAW